MSALVAPSRDRSPHSQAIVSRELLLKRLQRDLEFPILRNYSVAPPAAPQSAPPSAAAPAVILGRRAKIKRALKSTVKFIIHRMPLGARTLKLALRYVARPALRIGSRGARLVDRLENFAVRLELYLMSPHRAS